MEDLLEYVDWKFASKDILKKYGTVEFFNKYKDILDDSYYKHIIPTDELFTLLLKNDYPILENINLDITLENLELLIESLTLGNIRGKISKRVIYNILEVGENILTPKHLSLFNLDDNIEVILKSKAIVTIANKDIEYFLSKILIPQVKNRYGESAVKYYGICGALYYRYNDYILNGMNTGRLLYKILEIAKDIPLSRLFLRRATLNDFITNHMNLTMAMADPRFVKYLNDNKRIKLPALTKDVIKMSKKEFMEMLPYIKTHYSLGSEFFGLEKYQPNHFKYVEEDYMLKFELTEDDMIQIKTKTTFNMCSYIFKLYLRQHVKSKKIVPNNILELYDKHMSGMKTLLSQCRISSEYFFNNPGYFNLKYMKDNIDDYADSEDISLYLRMLNI